jgi:hypothetical protein
MLDVLLALDRIHEKWKFLIVDEPPQAISARKSLYDCFAVFVGPPAKICGHSGVKHTTRAVCHDVTDSGRHDVLEAKKMTGSSPVTMRLRRPKSLFRGFHGLVVVELGA